MSGKSDQFKLYYVNKSLTFLGFSRLSLTTGLSFFSVALLLFALTGKSAEGATGALVTALSVGTETGVGVLELFFRLLLFLLSLVSFAVSTSGLSLAFGVFSNLLSVLVSGALSSVLALLALEFDTFDLSAVLPLELWTVFWEELELDLVPLELAVFEVEDDVLLDEDDLRLED